VHLQAEQAVQFLERICGGQFLLVF